MSNLLIHILTFFLEHLNLPRYFTSNLSALLPQCRIKFFFNQEEFQARIGNGPDGHGGAVNTFKKQGEFLGYPQRIFGSLWAK
jgi:hypothetical protein